MENRPYLLWALQLTKELFDDAEGATGGPPRVTKFVCASDSPPGQKTASAPAATTPLLDADGRSLKAVDQGSMEFEP